MRYSTGELNFRRLYLTRSSAVCSTQWQLIMFISEMFVKVQYTDSVVRCLRFPIGTETAGQTQQHRRQPHPGKMWGLTFSPLVFSLRLPLFHLLLEYQWLTHGELWQLWQLLFWLRLMDLAIFQLPVWSVMWCVCPAPPRQQLTACSFWAAWVRTQSWGKWTDATPSPSSPWRPTRCGAPARERRPPQVCIDLSNSVCGCGRRPGESYYGLSYRWRQSEDNMAPRVGVQARPQGCGLPVRQERVCASSAFQLSPLVWARPCLCSTVKGTM